MKKQCNKGCWWNWLDLKRALELAQGIKAAQKDAKEIQSTENRLGHNKPHGTERNRHCTNCVVDVWEWDTSKWSVNSNLPIKYNECYHTGHITKACVDVSEWKIPIVSVVKFSGAIRLCGDNVSVSVQLQQYFNPLWSKYSCKMPGVVCYIHL